MGIHLSFVLFYVFLAIISDKLQYIIGIDCGATASEAVISPCIQWFNYKELRKKLPFSKINPVPIMPRKYPLVNFNLLGFTETAERLAYIIKDISRNAGLRNVLSVTAGVSGARYEKDRKKLEAFIKNKTKIKHVRILPDTEIAFATAFKPNQRNCGILIAGTGSILYYKDSKGKMQRVGGWGRLIGDEGSGYWIARNALSHVTKNFDKRGRKTLLSVYLDERYVLNKDTIITKIYHDGFALSKIAKLVFRAAEKGDAQSRKIIRNAAEELAEHFLPIKNRVYNIALMGSLFSEEKLLELELRRISKLKFPNIKFMKPNFKPVWGAIQIGHKFVNELKQA